MDSWLKKSHDNGIKRTEDDVEAVVKIKTNANRVFANVFAFCALSTSALWLFFSIE